MPMIAMRYSRKAFALPLAGEELLHRFIDDEIAEDRRSPLTICHRDKAGSTRYRRDGGAVKALVVATVIDEVPVLVVKDLPPERPGGGVAASVDRDVRAQHFVDVAPRQAKRVSRFGIDDFDHEPG